MFYGFGAAIVLATFLVVNAAVSVALMVLAPSIVGALAAARAQTRARALLWMRLVPSAAAAAVAMGLVLPAYLRFEPAQAGERVTLPLALLAAAALMVVLHGLLRGARALASTSALLRGWLARAEPVAMPLSPIPVYRVRDARAVFAVVGMHRPRMYVSDRVLEALAPAELAAAVAHECAHLEAADNVKRLLLRSCPDLVGLTPVSRAIEQEWARASEARADERASRGCRETALALAAGLIKVARLAPAAAGGLPVSGLHDGGDVDVRVRRLVAPAEDPTAGPAAGGKIVMRAALVLGVVGLTLASQAWPAVHRLIEVAARLLR
jgi:Zn-dependent protease with chaperone function